MPDTFDTINSSNTRTLTDVTQIDAPSYQEGYLNQLEKNWSNPDPGPSASVTAYRYTGKAIKSSLGADTYDGVQPSQDPDKKVLPNKKDAKQGNIWEQGPHRPIDRYKYFKHPVQNLLKIVRKLKDYSKLSEAYREKHLEVEHLTLTIRKLYYILIFIKDQIKSVAEAEDNIHELINTIVQEDSEQWKRFIDAPKLKILQDRQKLLKKDREKLEQVFEIASKSILRKLKRMGANMDGVVDLEQADPTKYGKWNTLQNVAQDDDEELQKLFQQYNKSITGQNQQIEFLLKFPNMNIDTLSEDQRYVLESEIETTLLDVLGVDPEKFEGQSTAIMHKEGQTGGAKEDDSNESESESENESEDEFFNAQESINTGENNNTTTTNTTNTNTTNTNTSNTNNTNTNTKNSAGTNSNNSNESSINTSNQSSQKNLSIVIKIPEDKVQSKNQIISQAKDIIRGKLGDEIEFANNATPHKSINKSNGEANVANNGEANVVNVANNGEANVVNSGEGNVTNSGEGNVTNSGSNNNNNNTNNQENKSSGSGGSIPDRTLKQISKLIGGADVFVVLEFMTSAPQSAIDETTEQIQSDIPGTEATISTGAYKTVTVDISIDNDEVDIDEATDAYKLKLKNALESADPVILFKNITVKQGNQSSTNSSRTEANSTSGNPVVENGDDSSSSSDSEDEVAEGNAPEGPPPTAPNVPPESESEDETDSDSSDSDSDGEGESGSGAGSGGFFNNNNPTQLFNGGWFFEGGAITSRKLLLKIKGDISKATSIINALNVEGVTTNQVSVSTKLGFYQWPFSETTGNEELVVGFGIPNNLYYASENPSNSLDIAAGSETIKELLDGVKTPETLAKLIGLLRVNPAIKEVLENAGIDVSQLSGLKVQNVRVSKHDSRSSLAPWPTQDGTWPDAENDADYEVDIGSLDENMITQQSGDPETFVVQFKVARDPSTGKVTLSQNASTGGYRRTMFGGKDPCGETCANITPDIKKLVEKYIVEEGELTNVIPNSNIDVKTPIMSQYHDNEYIARAVITINSNADALVDELKNTAQEKNIIIYSEEGADENSTAVAARSEWDENEKGGEGFDIAINLNRQNVDETDDWADERKEYYTNLMTHVQEALKEQIGDDFAIFQGRDKDNNPIKYDPTKPEELFSETSDPQGDSEVGVLLRINCPKHIVKMSGDTTQTIDIQGALKTILQKVMTEPPSGKGLEYGSIASVGSAGGLDDFLHMQNHTVYEALFRNSISNIYSDKKKIYQVLSKWFLKAANLNTSVGEGADKVNPISDIFDLTDKDNLEEFNNKMDAANEDTMSYIKENLEKQQPKGQSSVNGSTKYKSKYRCDLLYKLDESDDASALELEIVPPDPTKNSPSIGEAVNIYVWMADSLKLNKSKQSGGGDPAKQMEKDYTEEIQNRLIAVLNEDKTRVTGKNKKIEEDRKKFRDTSVPFIPGTFVKKIDGKKLDIIMRHKKINNAFKEIYDEIMNNSLNQIRDCLNDELEKNNGRRTYQARMGEDAENLVGAVKTYVTYRDHHYFKTQQPRPRIIEAVLENDTASWCNNPITSECAECPAGEEGIKCLDRNLPSTCVKINRTLEHICKESTDEVQAYTEAVTKYVLNRSGGQEPSNPHQHIFSNVVQKMEKDQEILLRMPQAGMKGKNIYYGPFSQVFNESAGNEHLNAFVSKTEANGGDNLLNKLVTKVKDGKTKQPANLTFFGFGFSGSGKTYTLLDNNTSLLQSSLGKIINADNAQRAEWGITDPNEKPVKKVTVKFYDLCPSYSRSDIYHYKFGGDGKLSSDDFKPNPYHNEKIAKENSSVVVNDSSGSPITKTAASIYDDNIISKLEAVKEQDNSDDLAYQFKKVEFGMYDYNSEIKADALFQETLENLDNGTKAKKLGAKSRLIKELYKSENRMKGGEYTLYDQGTDGSIPENNLSLEIADRFTAAFSQVEGRRYQTYRISPTPNNPTSSRAHLFCEVNIKDWQDKTSKFIVCDMAGSENTQQIKDDFFDPKKPSVLNLFGITNTKTVNKENVLKGYDQVGFKVTADNKLEESRKSTGNSGTSIVNGNNPLIDGDKLSDKGIKYSEEFVVDIENDDTSGRVTMDEMLAMCPDPLPQDSCFWIPGAFGDLHKINGKNLLAYARPGDNKQVLMFMFKRQLIASDFKIKYFDGDSEKSMNKENLNDLRKEYYAKLESWEANVLNNSATNALKKTDFEKYGKAMIKAFATKPSIEFNFQGNDSILVNGEGDNKFKIDGDRNSKTYLVGDAVSSFNGLTTLLEMQSGIWYFAPTGTEKINAIGRFGGKILKSRNARLDTFNRDDDPGDRPSDAAKLPKWEKKKAKFAEFNSKYEPCKPEHYKAFITQSRLGMMGGSGGGGATGFFATGQDSWNKINKMAYRRKGLKGTLLDDAPILDIWSAATYIGFKGGEPLTAGNIQKDMNYAGDDRGRGKWGASYKKISDGYGGQLSLDTTGGDVNNLKGNNIHTYSIDKTNSPNSMSLDTLESLISIMAWYVGKIVSQGDGIVATLEHLKQFFLSNNGSALQKYNDKNAVAANDNSGIPARMRNDKPTEAHDLKFSLAPSKYNIETDGIMEVKEAGAFMDFQMYPTLNALKTDDPKAISKYVMLCAILRGNLREMGDNTSGPPGPNYNIAFNNDVNMSDKYWQAAINSLEFAQSVSSTANPDACGSIDSTSIVAASGGRRRENKIRLRKRTLKKRRITSKKRMNRRGGKTRKN
jgi:hypothetical protein